MRVSKNGARCTDESAGPGPAYHRAARKMRCDLGWLSSGRAARLTVALAAGARRIIGPGRLRHCRAGVQAYDTNGLHEWRSCGLDQMARCDELPLVLSGTRLPVGVAWGIILASTSTGGWCNGSTADSDSACLGSNPSPPAFRAVATTRDRTRQIATFPCIYRGFVTPTRDTARDLQRLAMTRTDPRLCGNFVHITRAARAAPRPAPGRPAEVSPFGGTGPRICHLSQRDHHGGPGAVARPRVRLPDPFGPIPLRKTPGAGGTDTAKSVTIASESPATSALV